MSRVPKKPLPKMAHFNQFVHAEIKLPDGDRALSKGDFWNWCWDEYEQLYTLLKKIVPEVRRFDFDDDDNYLETATKKTVVYNLKKIKQSIQDISNINTTWWLLGGAKKYNSSIINKQSAILQGILVEANWPQTVYDLDAWDWYDWVEDDDTPVHMTDVPLTKEYINISITNCIEAAFEIAIHLFGLPLMPYKSTNVIQLFKLWNETKEEIEEEIELAEKAIREQEIKEKRETELAEKASREQAMKEKKEDLYLKLHNLWININLEMVKGMGIDPEIGAGALALAKEIAKSRDGGKSTDKEVKRYIKKWDIILKDFTINIQHK